MEFLTERERPYLLPQNRALTSRPNHTYEAKPLLFIRVNQARRYNIIVSPMFILFETMYVYTRVMSRINPL